MLRDHHVGVGGGVQRLIDAGAVIVATASMHELAFGVTGRNGWRGRATNPADPSRVPGGSSSGTAVAVKLGLVDVGIGTDTGGSCRIPAACCGIVGFRPSTGRYPTDGLLTLSQSRDTIGILATSIAEVAPFDSVLAGEPVGAEAPTPRPVRSIAVLADAVIDDFEPAVAEAYRAWIERCRRRGIDAVEVDIAPLLEWDAEAGFSIALRESILNFQRCATDRGVSYEEFVDGLANDDVRSLLATEPPTEMARQDALTRVVPLMADWYRSTFDEADILAIPTMPVLPPLLADDQRLMLHGEPVDTFPTMTMLTSPASLAGVPSLSVPISNPSDADGLFSIQIEGAHGSDRDLLAQALFLFDQDAP